MTDEKRSKIRRAALAVFLRYGYRRATMDDIAREVGMSRPALYLVFPGKEAVFRDVVEAGLEDTLRDVQAGLRAQDPLADQLRHVLETSSVRSYELVARAPAAAELIASSFEFVSDVFERYAQRLARVLTEAIRRAVDDPDALEPSAEARARILIASAHGFKTMARDAQDLRAFVHDLVGVTVAALPLRERRPSPPRRRRRRGGGPVSPPAGRERSTRRSPARS